MKVYLATYDDIDVYEVLGVFATKQAVKDFIDKECSDGGTPYMYRIEEYDLQGFTLDNNNQQGK